MTRAVLTAFVIALFAAALGSGCIREIELGLGDGGAPADTGTTTDLFEEDGGDSGSEDAAASDAGDNATR
ncbi:MAG: hypothetical protein R6V85_15940 [Polyangia bacterium]